MSPLLKLPVMPEAFLKGNPMSMRLSIVITLAVLCSLSALCAADTESGGGEHTGAIAHGGSTTPAEMGTELGKYKQYVYSVVGSYWYPDVNQHFSYLHSGVVHIQFTMHSNGQVSDVTVLDGDNLRMLKTISENAIIKPSPYKAFSDALVKAVGDKYTDDFTFTIK